MYTFRPDSDNGELFPVFMFQLGANGIGSSAINASTYDLFLEHLASYGYVVIVVNSSAAGFPNGSVYNSTYEWFQNRLSDTDHWMSGIADPQKLIIAGHSLGGVNASAFLIDNQTAVKGIVYFASFPSQGDPLFGILGHDVGNYSGYVLSIAGEEDDDSTPEECREGFDSFTAATCKYWVLLDGVGHGGFGDYAHPTQTVGSIGREAVTASIRHYLVSFMEFTFKQDGIAESNLKIETLRPNAELEFETNCNALVTSDKEELEVTTTLLPYPNPAHDFFIVPPDSQHSRVPKLMSLDGRELRTWEYSPEGYYRLDGIVSGTYLLFTHDKNGSSEVSKLIVR